MASYTETKYHCDNCSKNLNSCNNNLDIVTSKRESIVWSRLHVKIEHHHGVHNDSEREEADLCQQCAIKLLTDALSRVKKGERASEGTESSNQEGWE